MKKFYWFLILSILSSTFYGQTEKKVYKQNIRVFYISGYGGYGGTETTLTDYDEYTYTNYQGSYNRWEEVKLFGKKTISYDIEAGALFHLFKYKKLPRVDLEFTANYINTKAVTRFEQIKPALGLWLGRWFNFYAFYGINKYSFIGIEDGEFTYGIDDERGYSKIEKVHNPNILFEPNGMGIGLKFAYQELDMRLRKEFPMSWMLSVEYFPKKDLAYKTSLKYYKGLLQMGWGNRVRFFAGVTVWYFIPEVYTPDNPQYKIIEDWHVNLFGKLLINIIGK